MHVLDDMNSSVREEAVLIDITTNRHPHNLEKGKCVLILMQMREVVDVSDNAPLSKILAK
jgi:hypothetical protein